MTDSPGSPGSPREAGVLWFDDDDCRNVRIAGGKGSSLAAMTARGLPVPPGFVIAAHVLKQSIDADLLLELARNQSYHEAQQLVHQAEPPRDGIQQYLERLGDPVAVRSSATSEDSTTASYAGQQETYLHVSGVENVCRRVVDCWASFFSERAMFYRARKGSLDDLDMAVVVQKMLDPEKSGVVFTVHPVQRRRDRMVIEGVFGLGEQVVSGEVTPDHYVVDRNGAIKREQIVDRRVLTEEELRRLAELGRKLEEHFGGPQDIEWAMEGDQVYLLQSRPITTL